MVHVMVKILNKHKSGLIMKPWRDGGMWKRKLIAMNDYKVGLVRANEVLPFI